MTDPTPHVQVHDGPAIAGADSSGLPALTGFRSARPSVVERLAMGKALRRAVPRTEHARLLRDPRRADPVGVLEAQNATRVQKLIPLRYARMLASPFSFLRGAAAIMAGDLATTPVSGPYVNACGDMHVANFGVYASAERNLVFAINDFDEVHPAPWEWDVKRLATSAAVAARFLGGDKGHAADAARAIVRSYRRRIRRYAAMSYLEVWYDRLDDQVVLQALSPKVRKQAERIIAKARAKGHVQSLEKLTERVDGEYRFIENVPLVIRETHTPTGTPVDVALDKMLRAYLASLAPDRRRLLSRYRIVDVARKIVGVGSVGTECWVILLQGADAADPLFLQVKEAQRSVLAPHVDGSVTFENQAQRVVAGQRMTQGSPDIFLGWCEIEGKDFYIRQLADMKGGTQFEQNDRTQLAGFIEYCALCGWALALAHAKSGDPALIAGYAGKSEALDEAIGAFALAYAERTVEDHEALENARRAGRIQVADVRVAR